MEASASATAQALTLLTSSPRFLHLPLCSPARRHGRSGGGGGGLLLRPPPRRRLEPGSRARRPPRCLVSGGEAAVVDVLGGSVVAAAALLAALQLVWLRWHGARHRDSPEVLHEHDKSTVNKALDTVAKSVYDSNYAPWNTHENGFSELSVSGRMTVDEVDCWAGIFSCVDTVNKTTQDGSVITPWMSLDKFVDLSGPEEISCSTSAAKTTSIGNVTNILAKPHSVLEGHHTSKYFSNRMGRRGGLPHHFYPFQNGWNKLKMTKVLLITKQIAKMLIYLDAIKVIKRNILI